MITDNLPKVSIVVPIYNAAYYLEQCLESLFNQTYQNIEYILIDDASTDKSIDIIYSMASKYQNREVHIIKSEQNHGCAYSRTSGLKASSGEYILCCDGDDWIETDMVEQLICKALETKADIVTSPFYINYNDKQSIYSFNPNLPLSDLNVIPNNVLYFSLCNKIIKSSLIKDNSIYPIAGVDCWEDLVVTSRIYALPHKIERINKALYHYRKYDNSVSISHSAQNRILEEHLVYADYISKWFEEHNLQDKYAPFLKFLKFTAKIKMLRTKPMQFRRWKNTYPETNKGILSYKNIPLHYRLAFWLINLIP